MAQQDRKNPRTMVNKFDSTCGDCSREVVKGETILYHGRGYIQCNDCAPVNSTPTKPVSNAQAWQNALAWDNNEPDKGASIGGTATAVAVKPVAKMVPIAATDDQPADIGAQIADLKIKRLFQGSKLQRLQDQADKDKDKKSPDIGVQIIDDVETIDITDINQDQLDDISVSDRAEALTTELLIILINAIDVAGISGRHGLQAFCKENAGRSIDHSTRQHLWRGIGQAIQQS